MDRPVNVVMGLQGIQLSLAELSAIGVRRVRVGSALSRAVRAPFFAPRGRCESMARLHLQSLARELSGHERDVSGMTAR